MKCKFEDIEGECKKGNLRFFNLLVCDYQMKKDCDDFEESEGGENG